ncbi:MAG: tetratricopeptide repeat protein [Bacteroidales bacterium]|nr:tetratricopeptide repeat protein [Bacteroidales bacterium]
MKRLTLFLFLLPLLVIAQQSDEQMASYYLQNKEYDKATTLYEVLYDKTSNAFYYQMLYRCYVAEERYRDAEKLTQRRMRQAKGDLALYVDMGELYLKQGQKRKAEKMFNNAVDKVGFDGNQVGDLAEAFTQTGHLDWAVKTYLTARERTNNPYLYVMELATLYERQGLYEQMMQEYFDLLDKTPGSMGNIQLSLQRALQETSNPALAEGLRGALSSRLRKNPENSLYVEMMIWFCLQQNDFPFALTQAKAVDARFKDDGGQQVLRVAQIAQNNGEYATAIEGYQYLVRKGREHDLYFNARVGELDARFLQLNKNYAISPKDLGKIIKDYDNALADLGKSPLTATLMRNEANLLAYSGGDLQKASDLLYDVIEMPQLDKATLNETKLELGDLLLFAGEIWDASLLYSQVEKASSNDVTGAQAKLKNARLSYFNHDFGWAKAQLDVLRASTSKLVANDAMQLSLLISDNMEDDSTYTMLERYAAADLLLYRGRLEEAWQAFDTITMLSLSHPIFDEVLMQKAKIRMKQGRYAAADSLLSQLVELYGNDILADDAWMMRAELNENQLQNVRCAMECYEKIILDYPSSLYVERARRRYGELKRAR